MAYVTWGMDGNGKATIFCAHCRAVFGPKIDKRDKRESKKEIASNHHCTPPKPWRPNVNFSQTK